MGYVAKLRWEANGLDSEWIRQQPGITVVHGSGD